MRRYESYKDSGVEWLGEVPSHWGLTIGMNVFRENKRDNKGMKEKNCSFIELWSNNYKT